MPSNPYEKYLENLELEVVERFNARFSIHFPDGGPMMTFHGKFLYFSNKNHAKKVIHELLKTFDVVSDLRYGPADSKGRIGDNVL
ncbi:MAG TPA: hypothetical protein VN843_24340 [Anaerolineales bacterium]|nr:hypothetical protein [Anaerolineales bacterium]